MVPLTWMQPRDPRAAVKVVLILTGVGSLVTVAFVPLAANDASAARAELITVSAIAAVCAGLLLGAALLFDAAKAPAWALCPFLAITVVAVLDLATADASVAAQVFLLFPPLYAAALLPRGGVVLVTAGALTAEAVVALSILPLRDAVVDMGYVSAAIITTSVLLASGAQRQAVLTTELELRATTDSLTGLVTRRVFDAAAAAALVRPPAEGGTALVMLDVDAFKGVNDHFGHPGGDEVLVQLSQLLVGSSRRGDVVCRLGGDEMGLLLPDCPLEVAERRAEQLVEEVRGHHFVLQSGGVADVSVSVGVAHAPTHAVDARGLYHDADEALYAAKRAGRDRAVAFSLQAREAG